MLKVTVTAVAAALALAACSTTPPPPPGVVGEYRPIKRPDVKPPEFLTPKVFDFRYRGDPEAALRHLQALQPQLIVPPPSGTRNQAYLVDVDLRQVTLETALKRMGEQGGRNYEIVHKPDVENNRDFAYIRYLR